MKRYLVLAFVLGACGSGHPTGTRDGGEVDAGVDAGIPDAGPGPATAFVLSGLPSPQTAGASSALTVTAIDAAQATSVDYLGTVHVTSNDPAALLPADHTFTASEHGVHTFTVTLKTATTTAAVSVTDTVTPAITGTRSPISVTPAAATLALVTGFPSPDVAGTAGLFSVTLSDAFGNLATSYQGTLHFTSSDPQAVLPADYTFLAADQGSHAFSTTLKTATTSASITATDTTTAYVTGTQGPIVITPAEAKRLVVSSFPSPNVAGAGGTFTVTARDSFGNVATGYRGTVHVTSNDARAVLASDYTFLAADLGSHPFSTTLRTATSSASITATDTTTATVTGTQSPIVVVAGAATPSGSSLSCTPSRVLADDTQTVSCAATFADVFGNRLATVPLTWSVTCFDLIVGTTVACSGDTFVDPTSATTDVSGGGANALHSSHPQFKTIGATAGGLTGNATVGFIPLAGPRSIAASGGLFNRPTAVVASTGLLPTVGIVRLRSASAPGSLSFLVDQPTGGFGVTGLGEGVTGGTKFWAATNTGPSSLTVYNAASPGSVTSFSVDPGSPPIDVVAADIGNDGNSDLVVLGADDTLRYYTNSGTTTAAFSASPVTLATGLRPRGLAAGRVSGTGSMTVVIPCEGADTVQLSQPFCFFSCGDLGTTITLPAASHPVAVKVMPVAGESHLLVAEAGLDRLAVYRVSQDPGTLAWTVSLLQTLTTGVTPTSIATGTLNPAGAPVTAVAVGNELAGTVSVYLVGPAGTLTLFAVTSVGFQVSSTVFVPSLESVCSDDLFVTGPDGVTDTFVVRFTSATCPIF